VLNPAEGSRCHDRGPPRCHDIAHGSAGEIRGALDLADAWAGSRERSACVLLDRELDLLWASPAEIGPRPFLASR
jgi:hypothetical protein